MFGKHAPLKLGQVTRRFGESELGGWIIGLVAVGVLGLIASYMFDYWA